MKIRIKGNTLRIRVSRPEVNRLAAEGYLEEQTSFVNGTLIYALRSTSTADHLSADFVGNTITMYVPAALATEWPNNDVIGFNYSLPLNNTKTLSLLLEKDFVCLDATTEDQRDNYENPNKTC